MKSRIISIIMVALILVSSSQVVFATENEKTTDPIEIWNSMVVWQF